HGVISSKSGLSALEEKHLAKRARHSQEDDCYYVQEVFDPVRLTHFSEGSSILEDTTDSDGDISEREAQVSVFEWSVDTPLALLPDAPPLEEDTVDCQNWQETVEPNTLASLSSREIERQAVIYELFTTEASHLQTLRVLDQVFFQKMRNLLTVEELSCIFPNLPQVYGPHANLCESMKRLRDSPIVQGIGDIMVSRFEDAAGEEFSQQSQALKLIKNKRKDRRFAHLIQPLLRAQVCCRGILRAVNEVVRETEHRQLLSHYQRRLDWSPLERQASPVAAQFKNLDLTTKKMIHEGPLIRKVSKDKAIDIHALLLSDLLVLLQRSPNDRLILRCPARSLGGVGGGNTDLKTPFCPVVCLDSSLVRSVATGNTFYLVLPKDQMGLLTEESSTDDSSALEAASQKQKVTSLSSQQEGQEMPCQSPKGRSHLEMLSHETRPCQSRASIRQRMIKNVDGIFQTMKGLVKKLHQLREIEADHCRLLTM
ncbi:hypothetical protein P4O66_003951, partial [Electrophorus voltai]